MSFFVNQIEPRVKQVIDINTNIANCIKYVVDPSRIDCVLNRVIIVILLKYFIGSIPMPIFIKRSEPNKPNIFEIKNIKATPPPKDMECLV